jgi:putative hydrolase of the HAD superfamily
MPLTFAIFDLYNTLYHRESGLLQEIGHRVQIWVQRHFDLTWDAAGTLRRDYLHRYGTTMGGLIAEHDLDVSDYLHFVHDIPIEEYIAPDPALRQMLERISLRKLVFTNATSAYGQRVLAALGIADCFELVIGIEEVALRNKAYLDAYERMLALVDAEGEDCVMVEDWTKNLKPAKALGMKTILVDAEARPEHVPDYVDYTVDTVLAVGDVIERLDGRMN